MSEIFIEQAWSASDVETNVQSTGDNSAGLYFLVHNAEDETGAIAAAKAAIGTTVPSEYNGQALKSIQIDSRLSSGIWKIQAKYQTQNGNGGNSSDDEEDVFSFDVSSGSRRVVVPIRHVRRYAAPGYQAPVSQGINDGEGIDVMMPVGHFSVTTSMNLTTSKRKAICSMVGKMNSAEFKGYAAGEVLFIGVNGTRTGKEKWRVTFNFAMQDNQRGIDVGDISGIEKRGWDVLWVRYKEKEVTVEGKKMVTRIAVAAYTEQVFQEANLGSLGIGN